MSNIDEYGTLFIGDFCKTLGDLRAIVERADYYRLPDSTRCNGAVSLRVEGVPEVRPDGSIMFFPKAGSDDD